MVVSFGNITVFAAEDLERLQSQNEIEEKFSEYHEKIGKYVEQSAALTSYGMERGIAQVQSTTVSELRSAGYEAYDVNPDTYQEVEQLLNTDLSKMGANKTGFYIIVVEGDGNNNTGGSAVTLSDPYTSVGASFKYTYNGTTYTMRYATMTGAVNTLMTKSTSVNVLKTATQTLIQNCLDTAISAYISTFSSVLGTIASICGLSVGDIAANTTTTLNLVGATAWTRIYTQIYDDGEWHNGAAVEKVQAKAHMDGYYYDKKTNEYLQVDDTEVKKTVYSDEYYDTAWRNE